MRLTDEDLPAHYPVGNINPLHVSLLSFQSMKAHKKALKGVDVEEVVHCDADLLAPEIGIACLGEAWTEAPVEPNEQRETDFFTLTNQDDWKHYLNAVCEALGIENTEPDRVFHITYNNNHDGDPFMSIGDPFAGPHLFVPDEDTANAQLWTE